LSLCLILLLELVSSCGRAHSSEETATWCM